jgi:hypothetical protein
MRYVRLRLSPAYGPHPEQRNGIQRSASCFSGEVAALLGEQARQLPADPAVV